MDGIIDFVAYNENWGFIRVMNDPDDGSRRKIHFTSAALEGCHFNQLDRGDRVWYEVKPNDQTGPHAKSVRFISKTEQPDDSDRAALILCQATDTKYLHLLPHTVRLVKPRDVPPLYYKVLSLSHDRVQILGVLYHRGDDPLLHDQPWIHLYDLVTTKLTTDVDTQGVVTSIIKPFDDDRLTKRVVGVSFNQDTEHLLNPQKLLKQGSLLSIGQQTH